MWKKPDTKDDMIQFIFRKRQNFKDRKHISGCQEIEGWVFLTGHSREYSG